MKKPLGRYSRLKAKGLCVKCGLYPAEKTNMCLVCKMDAREYQREHYLANKERINKRKSIYAKKIYNERLKSGLCPYCGKRPPTSGKRSCAYCRTKANSRAKQRRAKKPQHGGGICLQCYELVAPGYKLCFKHLANARKASKKGVEVLKEIMKGSKEKNETYK